ncbi:hypothetical protein [Chitinophaga ginsengisoli]|uniref:Uncharacterized protein n=1 Tax=Chitinophaga ginsengisoli TaxID=363837 RepID=A0A2P8FUQ8_9BACT|nr:hypothetical protein [Chitinophaga ginsengisoli]PSL25459.1 hypothetical protein CLV42_113141 [Chitinophaga ginsengisoli]
MKKLLFGMGSAALLLTALTYTFHSKASAEPKVAAPAQVSAPCTGEAYKLINGVCQEGVKVWTRSEFDNVQHYYRCYYYYKWSDGSTSQEYYNINYAGCII